MPRINVYVSESMKERMDAVGDRVNWSEAAQAAFDREICINTLPKDPNMNQVIERLRASKDAFVKKETTTGREHGRDWAKVRASYEQLRTIAQIKLRTEDYGVEVDRALGIQDGGSWECSFWFEPDFTGMPSNEYVEGFVDGAKDIWDEVADKV